MTSRRSQVRILLTPPFELPRGREACQIICFTASFMSWASKGDAPCRASSLLPWRTNHPRSGCRASDVQQTQRTNVHFADIVRPSLEDFQPIALRLRLAFLGIYIAKAENAGWAVCNGEYFRKITTIYHDDKNYIFAFPAEICIMNATLQLYT